MKGFIALVRVSFLGILLTTAGGRGRGKNRRQMSGLAALGLLAFIMLVISGNYSFMLAEAMAPAGGLDIMLMVMILMGLLFCVIFTLYLSQSLIFSTKDVDLVLSLPVSSFSVLLARVMALYLEILFMMELFLLPAGIAWLTKGGGGGAGFIILLLVEGVFLSFVPAFVSLLFGSLISLLISKLRFKNLFNTLFSILLVGGIMVLSIGSGSYIENVQDGVDVIRASLSAAVPPLSWAVRAITEPSFPLLLLTIALCTLPFLLLAFLISRVYKKLLTNLMGQRVRNDYKLRRVEARGAFSALLGKEARRFFGTPAYILNSGMGLILLLLAGVAVLVFAQPIREVLGMAALFGGESMSAMIPAIALGILLLFLLMFNPTAVSISLEGKTLWILKEAPLDTGKIFLAKGGFAFLCTAICCVLVVPMAAIALQISVLNAIGILLVSLLFTAFMAMLGLIINLKHPRLDAENDTIVIKQSASVIISMVQGLGAGLAMAALYIPVYLLGWGFWAYVLLAVVALAAANTLAARWLNGKGRRLFAALA